MYCTHTRTGTLISTDKDATEVRDSMFFSLRASGYKCWVGEGSVFFLIIIGGFRGLEKEPIGGVGTGQVSHGIDMDT